MDRKKKKGRKEGRRREAGGRYKKGRVDITEFLQCLHDGFPHGQYHITSHTGWLSGGLLFVVSLDLCIREDLLAWSIVHRVYILILLCSYPFTPSHLSSPSSLSSLPEFPFLSLVSFRLILQPEMDPLSHRDGLGLAHSPQAYIVTSAGLCSDFSRWFYFGVLSGQRNIY